MLYFMTISLKIGELGYILEEMVAYAKQLKEKVQCRVQNSGRPAAIFRPKHRVNQSNM